MRFALAAGLMALTATPAAAQISTDSSLAAVAQGLANSRGGSAALTQAYLDRIAAMDRKGPTLRAVIALNPDALAQARASDARRKAGHPLSALDGVPILVKDNIETLDPMPTTAGSLALKDNVSHRDAPMIARLRAAGVIVLGKTNLSEWANIRSDNSMSGWSAVGGLVRNPHALDRTACGSSSGTGAGVAPSASGLPAISGYPHLSVPMGKLRGLPVGLSFIGPAYSEQMLLNAGYVFEQTAKVNARPSFAEHADAGPGVEGIR